MGFIDLTKKELNKAFTENGDKAYASSSSYCLDYFALVGGMRFNYEEALTNFLKAYYEDKLLAIKILFYTRDIKDGLGERNLFRFTFNTLCNFYPDVAVQLLAFIPKYGRYDDLLVALNSPIKEEVAKLIKEQLNEDIRNKKEGKPISLLAKWLPSINTSSYQSRLLAKELCILLDLDYASYRKTLSSLRKGIIIENNLRVKDYTFNYSEVPGGAMFKYRNAFTRNDNKRYNEYLEAVGAGKLKMNAKTLYPYQIVRRAFDGVNDEEERKSLNTIWNSMINESIDSKTIVVRDGSGSMYDGMNPSANDVASSLAILFAQRLTGAFHNKFITFSSKPQLVELTDSDIVDKCEQLRKYYDYTNTNIQKVYELIINVYKSKDFKKEDALDRIVIISDMEFDLCTKYDKSTFEYFKEEFNKLGYTMPSLVFYNVRARTTHLPTTMNEKGVVLVSGASQNVIDLIIENKSIDPYDFMLKCLEKYDCFNEIKF